MHVYHLKRHRLPLLLCIVLIVLGLTIFLAGCFDREPSSGETITLKDDTARVSYLESLGWQVDASPIESLDLQLPSPLDSNWQNYAQLQSSQGFSFGDYAGKTVQRYTYSVTNYPEIEKGVQVNLYLCEDVLIGGDIIFTGQGGFQKDLNYPAADQQ